MVILQIENLTARQSFWSGVWDNLFWPIVVGAVLGVGRLIWKKISKKKKKDTQPKIKLHIDKNGDILPISDEKFTSKIQLARKITRIQGQKGLLIELVPNYVTGHLDEFAKRALNLELENKSDEIEKKIEILLMRLMEPGLEHPDNLKTTINGLLARQPFDVTDRVKIEIFRTYDPKLTFPIYVTNEDFQKIAEGLKKTREELINDLRIPTMCSVSIFGNVLYSQIIPALVQEVYRVHTRFDFDLQTNHWESIFSYEVGLG